MVGAEAREVNPDIQNELNRIGHATELVSNAVFAFTVFASAIEIFRDKSPKNTLLKGMAIAAGIRAISAISDLGVDRINKINGLA